MDNEKFQELVLHQLKVLAEGQKSFGAGQESLVTGQTSLQKDVLRIETRMENEIIEKFRALYDDREVQNDRFDHIESKIDDIATDTRYLVARVAKLEKLAN